MPVKSEIASDKPSSSTPAQFLAHAFAAAKAAGCIFPEYAACEAALASNYGQHPTAQRGNNLFGFRVPAKPFQGMTTISTASDRAVNGRPVAINARLAFGSWQECFAYRAALMERVTMYYATRRATTGAEYLEAMTRFSPDPQYGAKVAVIYTANEAIFQ